MSAGSVGPVVRWINTATGEVKERHFAGRDPRVWSEHAPSVLAGEPQFRGEYDEWEATALELALALVPDLERAIDMARMRGVSVDVRISYDQQSTRSSGEGQD